MNIKNIYDRVTLDNPCEQGRFLSYLDTTVRTLISKRGESYVVKNGAYGQAGSVNDDIDVYDEYFPSIVSNVTYLLTGNENSKIDFVQEADEAYKSVWRKKVKGKRILDWGYYG